MTEKDDHTDSALIDLAVSFLSTFKDEKNSYKYLNIIDGLLDKNSFLVNTIDLSKSKDEKINDLYKTLCQNPNRILNAFYHAASKIFVQRHGGDKKIFVMFDDSFYNCNLLDALGNKFVGKLVTIEGMIVTMTDKFQIPSKLVFRCADGHKNEIEVKVTDKEVKVPIVCNTTNCKSREFDDVTMQEGVNFEQYRLLSLRSNNDFSLTEDELEILVLNDLTDIIKIGDTVRVTGIVHPTPYIKKNVNLAMYKTRLICTYIENIFEVDYTITEEDEENFKKMLKDPDFYINLINSIAPGVFGLRDIKESILLQRVGGYFEQKKTSKQDTCSNTYCLLGQWRFGKVTNMYMVFNMFTKNHTNSFQRCNW